MKTEVKKLDSNTREISIEVSGDIVRNKFDDVFGKVAKDAKIRGFRPGHAPREILEKQYSSDVHQQVIRELVPDVYGQAIEKEGLEVIDLPDIFDVKLDRGNLSFKAKVEVSPEIPVKNYKALKTAYKKIEVSDDEIKGNINSLKEARKVEAIDDNFARGLGYPNLPELEQSIRRQLMIQKDNQQRHGIENGIIENITKDLDFKLPQSMVNRQLQDLIRQTKLDLALKGVSREKIEEQEKILSSQLEPEARRQVKVYLSLAQIAKKENIAVDEHMPGKVMELLLREADWRIIDV